MFNVDVDFGLYFAADKVLCKWYYFFVKFLNAYVLFFTAGKSISSSNWKSNSSLSSPPDLPQIFVFQANVEILLQLFL